MNYSQPVKTEDSLARDSFNDPMDQVLFGGFPHIFLSHDASLQIHFMVTNSQENAQISMLMPTNTRDLKNHSFIVFFSREILSPIQSVLFFSFTFSSLEDRTINMCKNFPYLWLHMIKQSPESFDDVSNNDHVDSSNGHDGRSKHRGWRNKVKGIFHHL